MKHPFIVALIVLQLAPFLPAQPRPREGEPGLVIVIGGIGGWDVVGPAAQWALPQAGIHHEVREFVWTHGWGQLFKDLQDRPYVQKKAHELAEIIRQYRANHPHRRIYLIAKSGGTGLAVFTAELLPADTLERIVLLSSALSPTYDLRRALRATRNEIVSYHSAYDLLILNWGTRQFGTIDRQFAPSAGCLGFEIPENLDREDRQLYQKLVQVPWSPRMAWQANLGGHAGTSLPTFLSAEVSRWLR